MGKETIYKHHPVRLDANRELLFRNAAGTRAIIRITVNGSVLFQIADQPGLAINFHDRSIKYENSINLSCSAVIQ